ELFGLIMKTRAWNPPSLRFGATRMEDSRWQMAGRGWKTRSVLECGGPPPLSPSTDLVCPAESARGLAQSKTWRIFGALLTFLAITTSVRAQNYSIDWYKIAGGGGTSTGATYQVS